MYGVGFGYGSAGATTILSGGTSFDADAQSFFAASGITDLTQKNAVNQLVLDLKSNNLWTKMKALYPIVGGNATAHSKNLINPSQYPITWNGGIIHSSTGVLPNGTNGYGLIDLDTTTSFGLNPDNINLSTYLRTNVSLPNAPDIYLASNSGMYHSLQSKNPNNNSAMYGHTGIPGFGITSVNSDSRGFYNGGASSSSNTYFYKNSTSLGTSINAPTAWTGGTLKGYLFSNLSGYGARESAFASFGSSLTPSEVVIYNTLVQAFQTTLGRQV